MICLYKSVAFRPNCFFGGFYAPVQAKAKADDAENARYLCLDGIPIPFVRKPPHRDGVLAWFRALEKAGIDPFPVPASDASDVDTLTAPTLRLGGSDHEPLEDQSPAGHEDIAEEEQDEVEEEGEETVVEHVIEESQSEEEGQDMEGEGQDEGESAGEEGQDDAEGEGKDEEGEEENEEQDEEQDEGEGQDGEGEEQDEEQDEGEGQDGEGEEQDEEQDEQQDEEQDEQQDEEQDEGEGQDGEGEEQDEGEEEGEDMENGDMEVEGEEEEPMEHDEALCVPGSSDLYFGDPCFDDPDINALFEATPDMQKQIKEHDTVVQLCIKLMNHWKHSDPSLMRILNGFNL